MQQGDSPWRLAQHPRIQPTQVGTGMVCLSPLKYSQDSIQFARGLHTREVDENGHQVHAPLTSSTASTPRKRHLLPIRQRCCTGSSSSSSPHPKPKRGRHSGSERPAPQRSPAPNWVPLFLPRCHRLGCSL